MRAGTCVPEISKDNSLSSIAWPLSRATRYLLIVTSAFFAFYCPAAEAQTTPCDEDVDCLTQRIMLLGERKRLMEEKATTAEKDLTSARRELSAAQAQVDELRQEVLRREPEQPLKSSDISALGSSVNLHIVPAQPTADK